MPGWTDPTTPGVLSASPASCRRRLPGTAPPPPPPAPATMQTTAAPFQLSSATKPCEKRIEFVPSSGVRKHRQMRLLSFPRRYGGPIPLRQHLCPGVWCMEQRKGIRESVSLRVLLENTRNPVVCLHLYSGCLIIFWRWHHRAWGVCWT